MEKYLKWKVLLALCICCQVSCSVFQRTNQTSAVKIKAKTVIEPNAITKTDTSKNKVSTPKSYREIITRDAVTDDGMFKVHRLNLRYFFEIPDSLLNRDILVVNRIIKAGAQNRPLNHFFGYAGDQIGDNLIRFKKGPNNKLFMEAISYLERSSDSSKDGMYRSVANSNLQPIINSFDIKAFSPDSSGSVIEMTDYINGDKDVFSFEGKLKKTFGLGAVQTDRSYIERVSAYPQNIEIRTLRTYAAGDNAFYTYELNSSIVLLSKEPMKARLYDDRVGYFKENFLNFDNSKGPELKYIIKRWRLEPRDEDIGKYKSGFLVEPKKPIVFYIDPATPQKWVPYLIQGVNDWQKAFEKAGFKNAIYALEAPIHDSTWSLEDARHNAIVYKPSVMANAYGPNVHDPRTGEIIESHVQWFHNVQEVLHHWYMVQAGPNDPRARKMQFDDTLMGRLIRYVACHEIGHTLGLMHNFGASATVPTDSLRSKSYVSKNGFCPSIMDYSRFNYVAQPEDEMTENELMPRIGMYDEWAIEWGYRWLPQLTTEDAEKSYMNQWIISKLNQDKRFTFGDEFGWRVHDPSRNYEDLGENVIKSARYGMKNLKRVWSLLPDWTKGPNADYRSLAEMYANVYNRYINYLQQIITHLGGRYVSSKRVEQEGEEQVRFISKERQKEAVQFLIDELFTKQDWLMDRKFHFVTGANLSWGSLGTGNTQLFLQKNFLALATSHLVLRNLLIFENYEPGKAYSVNELFYDLEAAIWKNLKSRKILDMYQRNMQKVYVVRLLTLLDYKATNLDVADDNQSNSINSRFDDVLSIIKGRISNLGKEIEAALPFYTDQVTRFHLEDLLNQLKGGMRTDLNKPLIGANLAPNRLTGVNLSGDNELSKDSFFRNLDKNSFKGCWFNADYDLLPEALRNQLTDDLK